jgi:hypothetical protein
MIGTGQDGVNSGAGLPAGSGVTVGSFRRILPGAVPRMRAAVFAASLLLAACTSLPGSVVAMAHGSRRIALL